MFSISNLSYSISNLSCHCCCYCCSCYCFYSNNTNQYCCYYYCYCSGCCSYFLHVWYLDDGMLCGPTNDPCSALAFIEEEGPARALHLNRGKCLLHIPTNSPFNPNPLPPDIPISKSGFVLLGSPIGPASSCQKIVMTRVQKVRDLLSQLPDLQYPQMETAILHSCLAFPKILFTLRSCPLNCIQEAVFPSDNSIENVVSDLVGGTSQNGSR